MNDHFLFVFDTPLCVVWDGAGGGEGGMVSLALVLSIMQGGSPPVTPTVPKAHTGQ